jgi:hypothetical protein
LSLGSKKVGSIDETIEIWLAENALPMEGEQMRQKVALEVDW